MQEYDDWNELKQDIHLNQGRNSFGQQEVWWCNFGVNIGYEIYGKSKLFTRPVLIIKKYSNNFFLGLPMSTQYKNNKYYYPLEVDGRQVYGLVSQIRSFDSKRLLKRFAYVYDEEFSEVTKYIADGIFPRD